MSLRPLFTRADDAGACADVNHGILDCLETGLVHNVSVMVVGPAFEQIAARLRDRDDIAVGLHLTLNAEWPSARWRPVLPPDRIPGLVDADGAFTTSPSMLHDRSADLGEMIAETRAQLARARDAGLRISYLDTHMGVGWVRGESLGGRWRGGLATCLEVVAREQRLVFADALAPALELPPADDPFAAWNAALAREAAGPRALVTHPAVAGPELLAFTNADHRPGLVAAARDAERRAWLHPGLAARLRDHGWRPARYDETAPAA